MLHLSSRLFRNQVCLSFALFSTCFSTAIQAADGPPQSAVDEPLFVCRLIEISPDNVQQWKEAVERKQQKFNSQNGAPRWGTWRIMTGPRTGQFVRGFSSTRRLLTNPIHPIQGFTVSQGIPELDYWMKHVLPLQETSGNRQVWRPIPGLWSRGITSGLQPRYWHHRRWRMKPGMYQRLEANYRQIIAAFEHLDRPIDFGIARLDDGGDFMIYGESTGYNDAADIPTTDELAAAFKEVHGDDAWKEFLEEHNAVMQENAVVETETWVYQKRLSNLNTVPNPAVAQTLVREHIGRVVDGVKRRDSGTLSDEYVAGAIRSLGSSPLPVQGRKEIRKAIADKLQADQSSGAGQLRATVLDAEFLNTDTILAHGTFEVVSDDGSTVRQGKWGDVLKVEDGQARFLLASAYVENLKSITTDTDSLVTDVQTLADPESLHFQRMSRSIQRFTEAFNRGDDQSLADEFTEDGVRLVSGLAGVFAGRDAIRKSFLSQWSGEVDVNSGMVLSAKVLAVRPIDERHFAGAGIWRLKTRDGKLIDGGHWGNVFRLTGGELKLLQECAGSATVQAE